MEGFPPDAEVVPCFSFFPRSHPGPLVLIFLQVILVVGPFLASWPALWARRRFFLVVPSASCRTVDLPRKVAPFLAGARPQAASWHAVFCSRLTTLFSRLEGYTPRAEGEQGCFCFLFLCLLFRVGLVFEISFFSLRLSSRRSVFFFDVGRTSFFFFF